MMRCDRMAYVNGAVDLAEVREIIYVCICTCYMIYRNARHQNSKEDKKEITPTMVPFSVMRIYYIVIVAIAVAAAAAKELFFA